MTKLDEIEADYMRDGYVTTDSLLLIRAARQLGKIVRERESKSITANRIEHGSLDPDVMELIAYDKGR